MNRKDGSLTRTRKTQVAGRKRQGEQDAIA